ncbi:unnamed protein product, partial [Polarella glacialis]
SRCCHGYWKAWLDGSTSSDHCRVATAAPETPLGVRGLSLGCRGEGGEHRRRPAGRVPGEASADRPVATAARSPADHRGLSRSAARGTGRAGRRGRASSGGELLACNSKQLR